ncbi:DUF2029 domain-containing protein [Kitasatospora sp. DSM 101779]|nr:DUF2029 domain-containing protein [Kitasatospora sp. DSM 101779]
MLVITARQAYHSGINTMDDAIVVKAARTFLHGGSPYADKRFLYFPSAVLAAVPQALVSTHTLKLVVPCLTLGLVVLGWFLALRIFNASPFSRLSVLGLFGLAFFEPLRNLTQLGNWTAVSVAALPGALLLARRSRWVWAGVVIGLAIAVKPMLVPVGLLFLFARRPLAFAAAALVPAVASAGAAAVMPQPSLFFTKTLPFLMHGQDQFAAPYDGSLTTVLPRLGVPHAAAIAVAAALALSTLVLAWRRWARGGDEGVRLVEVAAMLMLVAFLFSKPAFDHYMLVVLVPLAASIASPESAVRSPWFLLALVPHIAAFQVADYDAVQKWAFKVAATHVTIAVLLGVRTLRPARPVAHDEQLADRLGEPLDRVPRPAPVRG